MGNKFDFKNNYFKVSKVNKIQKVFKLFIFLLRSTFIK